MTMQTAERAAGRDLTCAVCQTTFSRLEHLQRHTTASHSAERPFSCKFCKQSFARRDVLVRHLKSCKSKPSGSGPLSFQSVPSGRRGRKRRSCDDCARSKRACSGTQPCLSCVHRRQSCHYTKSTTLNTNDETSAMDSPLSSMEEGLQSTQRIPEPPNINLSTFAINWPEEGLPSVATQQTSYSADFDLNTPITADSSATRLSFLANFTSTNGIADSFQCGIASERMRLMEKLLAETANSNDCTAADSSEPTKTQEIASNIKRMLVSRPHQPDVTQWSQDVERSCLEFFSPANLSYFLLAYFTFWQANCPIVHKPTFEMQSAPATLVAVMALLGACLSPTRGHREAALIWLDPVEHWIFSTPEFSDSPLSGEITRTKDPKMQERLDALRAAYCAILLQTWEGNEEAKRRSRRSRYTDIIGVFRSVCGKELTHGHLGAYLSDTPSPETWKDFAATEEVIRTATYISMLDSAYVIFNNTPPRMAFREHRMALTCPDACFEAESLEDWMNSMRLWATSEIGVRQPTLTKATSLLFQEQISPNEWQLLQQTSCLNMFAMIHPIHVQLFQVRCHPIPSSQTQILRRALDNWMRIWLQRSQDYKFWGIPTSPQKLSFSRFAPEFWFLADHILSTSETTELTHFDQTEGINESLIAQLLSRYDESDMSQVHDLVSLFNSLSLEL